MEVYACVPEVNACVYLHVCMRLCLCACTDVVALSCGRQNVYVVVVELIKIAQIRFAL